MGRHPRAGSERLVGDEQRRDRRKAGGRSAGGHQESGALPAQRHQKRNDRPLPQEDRRTGRRSQERWHTDAWGGRPASHGLAVREYPRRDSRL